LNWRFHEQRATNRCIDRRRVSVDAAAVNPLIGMTLLRDDELTVQVVSDGRVTIQPLPSNAETMA
jgi:hypothetical protein